jgi:serine/threonine protein kinase
MSTPLSTTCSFSDDDLEEGPVRSIQSRTLENAMNPVGSRKNDLCDVDMAIQAWGPELGIDPADLTIGKCLGSGLTAEVFEGVWQGKAVAVKRMPMKQNMVSFFVRELGVMAKASHPNLVRLLGFCSDGSSVDVVLELCRGGSLFHMLHVSDVEVNSRQQVKIASDIADAMTYLHGMDPPVMHRDLKSLNVLLLEPLTSPLDVPTAKLTDFGLAKVRYRSASVRHRHSASVGRAMTVGVGTVQWMAPEMLAGSESYGAKVDLYAYGVLLYEIWHFEPPFAELEANQVAQFVLGGGRPPVDWKTTPEPLARLIDSCWAQQARERPTFGAVARALRSLQGRL